MNCPNCAVALTPDDVICPRCSADPQSTKSDLSGETRQEAPVRDLEFIPGDLFAGRYIIIEKAGGGGMGVVYKAIDSVLNISVALKLIRSKLAGLPSFVEQFKDEVRLTRLVSHVNVCRVHDLGESDGILYLSMEWIDGETLRQLLHQARTLTEDRALGIAGRIADALAAAHAKGIVHRDLKPDNVMIDADGGVHVMDFGLALEPGAMDAARPEKAVGTPGYMSPEQGRGEKVDMRTDIYALGLILREMLTGSHPERQRQNHTGSGPMVAGPIVPVLRKLVAERREDRCPSASEAAIILREVRSRLQGFRVPSWILAVLRWRFSHQVATAMMVVLVGVVLFYVLRDSGTEQPVLPPPEPASPALIFYQRAQHYFQEEGHTERGINNAIQMFHRAIDSDPEYALSWAGLGEAYWTRFERTGEDSSREEGRRAVARAMELAPHLPEACNAKAVGLIAEGHYEDARKELERMVADHPGFDAAWANLGNACEESGDYACGLRSFQKAIELKPDSFRYLVYLGHFHDHFSEYEEAATAYRRATELKPDSPIAWNSLGGFFLRTGEFEEAIVALDRSIDIEDSAFARTNIGTAHYALGDYARAAESYRLATEMQPNFAVYWGNLGDALKVLGDPGAREAYLKAANLSLENVAEIPDDPVAREEAGLYCAKAGLVECALREGSKAVEMQPENAEMLFSNAIINCLLDHPDEALDWLHRSVDLGMSSARIEIEADLDPLRAHPRYATILELAK